jgi:hypothetical protein
MRAPHTSGRTGRTLAERLSPVCLADYNGDADADVLDFLDFLDAFGIGC